MRLCHNGQPMPHDHSYPDGKCWFDGPEDLEPEHPAWCHLPDDHEGPCPPKNNPVLAHPYEPSPFSTGDTCVAMVMRDGGGDQCGRPRDHEVHRV